MDLEEQKSLLRLAVERFNAVDITGLAELLHPMAEWPDLMDDKLIWGRDAIRSYWERQFVVVAPELTIRDLVPADDDLVLVADQRAVDPRTGQDLVPPTVIYHRYSFRDGLIAKLVHATSLDEALRS